MSDRSEVADGFVPDLARYEQLVDEAWVREGRHKVMYRDESKVD